MANTENVTETKTDIPPPKIDNKFGEGMEMIQNNLIAQQQQYFELISTSLKNSVQEMGLTLLNRIQALESRSLSQFSSENGQNTRSSELPSGSRDTGGYQSKGEPPGKKIKIR